MRRKVGKGNKKVGKGVENEGKRVWEVKGEAGGVRGEEEQNKIAVGIPRAQGGRASQPQRNQDGKGYGEH